jgi:hypothetical protein
MCACGYSLNAAQTATLPADHVVVAAQRQIFDIIEAGETNFGVFADNPISVREVLAAVRSLANRVLNYASTYGLAAVKSAEVSSWTIADDPAAKPSRARNALNETAPTRAIETAVGVTAALDILRCSSVRDAGIRARWFIEADTGPGGVSSCARWITQLVADGRSIAVANPALPRRMGQQLRGVRVAATAPLGVARWR